MSKTTASVVTVGLRVSADKVMVKGNVVDGVKVWLAFDCSFNIVARRSGEMGVF